MSEVRLLEETVANVNSATESFIYDGWLVRFTPGGYSKSHSSVWPLYAGSLPLEAKIDFCEQMYQERDLSCAFRLSTLPGHEQIQEALAARGYVAHNPNLVMVRPSTQAPAGEITVLGLDDWLDTAFRINPVDDPNLKDWMRRVWERQSLPTRFAVVLGNGDACAYGYSIQQGDQLYIRELWVTPAMRGRGVGTQLIHGLMQLGRENGAQVAIISVNEPNSGARRLYERLGFVTRYRYRYLIPEILAH